MKIKELIKKLQKIEDKDQSIDIVLSDEWGLCERAELKYVENSEYEGWQLRGETNYCLGDEN